MASSQVIFSSPLPIRNHKTDPVSKEYTKSKIIKKMMSDYEYTTTQDDSVMVEEDDKLDESINGATDNNVKEVIVVDDCEKMNSVLEINSSSDNDHEFDQEEEEEEEDDQEIQEVEEEEEEEEEEENDSDESDDDDSSDYEIHHHNNYQYNQPIRHHIYADNSLRMELMEIISYLKNTERDKNQIEEIIVHEIIL